MMIKKMKKRQVPNPRLILLKIMKMMVIQMIKKVPQKIMMSQLKKLINLPKKLLLKIRKKRKLLRSINQNQALLKMVKLIQLLQS